MDLVPGPSTLPSNILNARCVNPHLLGLFSCSGVFRQRWKQRMLLRALPLIPLPLATACSATAPLRGLAKSMATAAADGWEQPAARFQVSNTFAVFIR
jgi:hypothetical protein